MRKRKKPQVANDQRRSKRSSVPTTDKPTSLGYSATLAEDLLNLLDDLIKGGKEALLTFLSQLAGPDARYALVSAISNFSVADIKESDPDLRDFRSAMTSSLRSNPRVLIKLVGYIKKASAQNDTITDPEQRQVYDALSKEMKTMFGL